MDLPHDGHPGGEPPSHSAAFAAPGPVFADPHPGCKGTLELLGEDNPVLSSGGWATHVQRLYRCRACGVHLGLLDRRVVWVQRTTMIKAGVPIPIAHRPSVVAPPPGARSRDRGSLKSKFTVKTFRALAALADEHGLYFGPNAPLEEHAGIGRRSLQYGLAHLDAAGIIRIEGGSHARSGRRIALVGELPFEVEEAKGWGPPLRPDGLIRPATRQAPLPPARPDARLRDADTRADLRA